MPRTIEEILEGHAPLFEAVPEDAGGPSGGRVLSDIGDRVHIGYITHDPDPGDFWEGSEGLGSLRLFRTGDDPNALMDQYRKEGEAPLFVERYAHGAEHYSVAGTRDYPDRRWDVAVCGIFLPCEEVRDRYHKACNDGTPELARKDMVQDTNGVLDEYSRTVNGEVYGVVVETLRREGDILVREDHDAVWGHIGADWAVEALADMMPEPEPALEP